MWINRSVTRITSYNMFNWKLFSHYLHKTKTKWVGCVLLYWWLCYFLYLSMSKSNDGGNRDNGKAMHSMLTGLGTVLMFPIKLNRYFYHFNTTRYNTHFHLLTTQPNDEVVLICDAKTRLGFLVVH